MISMVFESFCYKKKILIKRFFFMVLFFTITIKLYLLGFQLLKQLDSCYFLIMNTCNNLGWGNFIGLSKVTIRKKKKILIRGHVCNITGNILQRTFQTLFLQSLVPIDTVVSEENTFLYIGQRETRMNIWYK